MFVTIEKPLGATYGFGRIVANLARVPLLPARVISVLIVGSLECIVAFNGTPAALAVTEAGEKVAVTPAGGFESEIAMGAVTWLLPLTFISDWKFPFASKVGVTLLAKFTSKSKSGSELERAPFEPDPEVVVELEPPPQPIKQTVISASEVK